jgi:hypothetical protein
MKTVYLAGPMRRRPYYNFPEFDRVGGVLLNAGYSVISPADLDREKGNFDPLELPSTHDWSKPPEGFDLRSAYRRDVMALMACTHICLLDGWTESVGARCEYWAARWLGLHFVFELDGQVWEEPQEWEPAASLADDCGKPHPYCGGKHEEPVVTESVLEEAIRITGGDRQAQYGPPDQDFRRTADMWTGLFSDLLKDGTRFEPYQVALAMILLKASRQVHQRKRDNWTDVAGYAHCGAVCDEQAKRVQSY